MTGIEDASAESQDSREPGNDQFAREQEFLEERLAPLGPTRSETHATDSEGAFDADLDGAEDVAPSAVDRASLLAAYRRRQRAQSSKPSPERSARTGGDQPPSEAS
jgi:hypothetical protein